MSTSPPVAPPADPAAAVVEAAGVLDSLDGVLWAAKSPAQLVETTVALERLRSRLAAVSAQVAVEVEASEAAKSVGWVSPGDFLTATSGGRKGCGQRMLRTGRALTGEREATWVALHAGDISPEHAEVIVRAVERLPVDPAVRDRAEAHLIGQAAHLNASELLRAAEHLLEVVDPEGVAGRDERALDRLERSAHLGRELVIAEDGLGGVRLRGRGTVEDAAVLKAALAALAGPNPTTPDAADGAGTGGGGVDAGEPDCDARGRDLRDHGARCWDSLVGVCRAALDAEVLPESHGVRPRVVVTVDFDALAAGVGVGILETGEALSAAAVRRLACDADLIPAVLGSRGEVLDVGRAQRLVTTAMFTALVLRDRHCAFPGCRRPPVACDAHHLRYWAEGGPTSLANLVLLCRAHHTLIHSSGWRIRLNPADQRPEFQPPPGRLRRAGPDWIREPRPRE